MAPCALSHYVSSDSGTLPKFFKGGYLDVGLPLAWINLMNVVCKPLLGGFEVFMAAKVNKTKLTNLMFATWVVAYAFPYGGSLCDVVQSLTGHTSPVESVAFDSAEVLVAAGASSGVVQLWDLEETKVQWFEHLMDTGPIAQQWNSILLVNFLHQIWDLTAGKLLHEFKLHEGHIRSMDFHPLEFLLATGSSDKTVKFWDLESFELIGSTSPEATGVRSVYSLEPVVCHDVVDLEWSTLGDLCINDGKLLGCSYYQNSVGIWAADVSQIEPYKVQPKSETPRRTFISPDDDTKDIKNIYIDSMTPVTCRKEGYSSKDVTVDSNKQFKSVDSNKQFKYVNGVAVVNGRTRSLVEKFEKRDKLDTNECHKPDLTSQILPNTNNVPTTTIQQSINMVSCTIIPEPTTSPMPVTEPDMVRCVQPMIKTKTSQIPFKTPDLVVQTSKNSPITVREKTKASPIKRPISSRRVIPEKNRSQMLVARRSRAMKEDNPQTTGVKNENNDDLAEFLMLDHDLSLSTLRSRLTKLQVQADVISVMLDNTESLTLDLFSCLLPLLSGLLDSQTERHINVSLKMLLKLVAVFGPVINSTISAPPTVGVDLHAEKRRGGLTAKTAQELNRILQQS
ncbi:hypothetical protein L1987_58612 [Smallanthus sonchifolius]|uniref:Uncharacterized protein n=1 Tax=Smallanthus sonchifolius TaxID=185202 RepID=A0ACB9DG84_9ASTR|nr:hypothetical protein L1987_58612 [Smallanthus sonchifolius]